MAVLRGLFIGYPMSGGGREGAEENFSEVFLNWLDLDQLSYLPNPDELRYAHTPTSGLI